MLCSGEDILTAGQLGLKYADSLAKEANAASSVYRYINLLLDLDIREYVEGRNPVLLSFLVNMSMKTTLICEDKELCVLGGSIEHIELMDTNNISPRLVQSAKHKFSPLLHARNHPKYQVIDIL